MRITYQPANDFHNMGPITLIVSGEKASGMLGEMYRISKKQSKRITDHFCGMSDCSCGSGPVEALDFHDTAYGIPVCHCGN